MLAGNILNSWPCIKDWKPKPRPIAKATPRQEQEPKGYGMSLHMTETADPHSKRTYRQVYSLKEVNTHALSGVTPHPNRGIPPPAHDFTHHALYIRYILPYTEIGIRTTGRLVDVHLLVHMTCMVAKLHISSIHKSILHTFFSTKRAKLWLR